LLPKKNNNNNNDPFLDNDYHWMNKKTGEKQKEKKGET